MSKNYTLIVIEGVDSSGKETQTTNLYNRLLADNTKTRRIEFPNYKSETSSLVKMYLNGDFGKDADSVSPYMASAFFAVDRAGSMKCVWKEMLDSAEVVIADRYVTSNMIHQASKIESADEKEKFLDWIYDFEYNKLELPVPDLVIFLDMPVESALQLMKNRPNKINNSGHLDIHESDKEYLGKSYENALYVANKYDWCTVKCAQNGIIRPIDDISDEIYKIVSSILKDKV